MPVTVVTAFRKKDASTDDYTNPEVKKVIDEYVESKKITSNSSARSGDGLTQQRTRVFTDQETYDAFKLEEGIANNKAIRDKWCEDNNVTMSRTVVSK